MTVCGFHAALYGAASIASEFSSFDLSNEPGDTASDGSFALPTKIWKTTPCKVADSCWHDAMSDSAKTFDTSGKSAALLHHRAMRKTSMPCPTMGPAARLSANNPFDS